MYQEDRKAKMTPPSPTKKYYGFIIEKVGKILMSGVVCNCVCTMLSHVCSCFSLLNSMWYCTWVIPWSYGSVHVASWYLKNMFSIQQY